jgi:hypothetical protein
MTKVSYYHVISSILSSYQIILMAVYDGIKNNRIIIELLVPFCTVLYSIANQLLKKSKTKIRVEAIFHSDKCGLKLMLVTF